MILQDLRQLKTGPRELRKFGLLVGGVFAVLGLLMWVRGKPLFPWFLTPGILLVLCGAVTPRALKPVYLAWMFLALVLGFVVSNIILTVLFLTVFLAVGLTARLFGKDFLGLRLDRNRPSYWIRRERRAKVAAEYEQQY